METIDDEDDEEIKIFVKKGRLRNFRQVIDTLLKLAVQLEEGNATNEMFNQLREEYVRQAAVEQERNKYLLGIQFADICQELLKVRDQNANLEAIVVTL